MAVTERAGKKTQTIHSWSFSKNLTQAGVEKCNNDTQNTF